MAYSKSLIFMRRINSQEELKKEQMRLKSRRVFLENEIRRDFKELKEELEPVKILGKSAKKTLLGESNKGIGNAVGQLANFLARSALRRSGLLTRLVVPYLVKNVTGKIVEKNKTELIGWVGGLLTRLTGRKTLNGRSVRQD
jgi:hypothetical protein